MRPFKKLRDTQLWMNSAKGSRSLKTGDAFVIYVPLARIVNSPCTLMSLLAARRAPRETSGPNA
jgi:hypothetical protein